MADTDQSQQYISTTALAKKMGKEAREVFSLLSDGGWLIKVDKRWQLTNKGRFEGGVLLDHPKFGEYVAWPSGILDHAILKALPDTLWNTTRLAKQLLLPTRLLNLLLHDLALIKPGLKGWLLQPLGRRLGGYQSYTDKTGIPFVSWPEEILGYEPLLSALKAISAGESSLSGRQCESASLQMLDNWLYLQGFHYRSTALSSETSGDFYFPRQRVSIVVSSSSDDAATIAKRLSALEVLRQDGSVCVEISDMQAVDIKALDELMSRLLLQAGIVSSL